MTCPYCFEEIKDEALVCKHCRQNLMVFKPLVDRLSQLEEQIAEIIASISDLQAITPAARVAGTRVKKGLAYQPIMALVLPVLTSLTTYWFMAGTAYQLYYIGQSLSSPLYPLEFGLE